MSPAEAAAFRRRWLVRGLAAACTLLVLWNIWGPLKSLYRDLFPVKLSEMAVEQLAGEYAADAAAADKKFAQRRVILRGKLIIQTDKQRRSRHVYLEVPGQEGDLRRITCDFADPDEAATVSSGKTYRISGLVQHEKGSGLKLQYASLMGEAS